MTFPDRDRELGEMLRDRHQVRLLNSVLLGLCIGLLAGAVYLLLRG